MKRYDFKIKCYRCNHIIPYQTTKIEGLSKRRKQCYYCPNKIKIKECMVGDPSIHYS